LDIFTILSLFQITLCSLCLNPKVKACHAYFSSKDDHQNHWLELILFRINGKDIVISLNPKRWRRINSAIAIYWRSYLEICLLTFINNCTDKLHFSNKASSVTSQPWRRPFHGILSTTEHQILEGVQSWLHSCTFTNPALSTTLIVSFYGDTGNQTGESSSASAHLSSKSGVAKHLAPSWISTCSASDGSACNPLYTDSWRVAPPVINSTGLWGDTQRVYPNICPIWPIRPPSWYQDASAAKCPVKAYLTNSAEVLRLLPSDSIPAAGINKCTFILEVLESIFSLPET